MFTLLMGVKKNSKGIGIGDVTSMLDGTANVGTDVLNFTKNITSLSHITAVELGYTEFVILEKNIERMKYEKRIHAVNGNIVDHVKKTVVIPNIKPSYDLVYLDPPWGGLNWADDSENELVMSGVHGNVSIRDLVVSLIQQKMVSEFVVIKTPHTYKIGRAHV
jgi:16S rRNA G966 N2-methylase RsmD